MEIFHHYMIFYDPLIFFRYSVGAPFEGHNRPKGSFDVLAFTSNKQVSHNVGPSRKVQNLIGQFRVLLQYLSQETVITQGKLFSRVASETSLLCLMCLCIGIPGMWWTTTFRQGETVRMWVWTSVNPALHSVSTKVNVIIMAITLPSQETCNWGHWACQGGEIRDKSGQRLLLTKY